MTSTGWRPLPLILGCFGCLFSALLNIWRWILRQKCCQNNYCCCCCYCHNRNTGGKKSLIKIEEGTTINEEQHQSISVDQPLLLLCSPLPLIEETPLPSLDNEMRKIPSHTLPNKKEAEETRSLDRHLFSVRWNKRGTSTTKINCKNNIRPSLKATTTQILEKKKNNHLICDNFNGGDDFDSPAVALIDPCTSSASSPATAAVQNSSCFQQQPSVPQRLACFLSKRLKRTKSFPKLASALSRDRLTATTTTLNSIGKQGEHQLKIRASLGSNALRWV
ncbi:unnamed protein product [Meloidogyne enterolobii]|uniref:Uncharacterized protein n=1 Tax=Meloidogyne enterolobii TaxID=390850 RepID=A0ACB1A4M6_MELEN